jgi:penicillin-binding protein 1A
MQVFFSRLLKWLALAAAALVVVVIGLSAFWLITLTRDLPSVETLQDYAPPITTRVYAGNGTVLGEFAHERRIFVPAAFIPKLVKQAFLSAEDRNFYNHPGVDPSGILRAAIKDVGPGCWKGAVRKGASTITQQVARDFLLIPISKWRARFAKPSWRCVSTPPIPKEKVLELYLNEINLGQNSYGVGARSLNYFGKVAGRVDHLGSRLPGGLAQIAQPLRSAFHHQAALDRRNWVISQMRRTISSPTSRPRRQGRTAGDPDPRPGQPGRRRGLLCRGSAPASDRAYRRKGLYDGGLQVRASLDTRLQNYAVGALRTGWCAMTAAMAGAAPRSISICRLEKEPRRHSRSLGHRDLAAGGGAGYDGKMSQLGFADGGTGLIPYDGYKWANRQLPGAVWGPRPTTPEEVVKPGERPFMSSLCRRRPRPASSGCAKCRRSMARLW